MFCANFLPQKVSPWGPCALCHLLRLRWNRSSRKEWQTCYLQYKNFPYITLGLFSRDLSEKPLNSLSPREASSLPRIPQFLSGESGNGTLMMGECSLLSITISFSAFRLIYLLPPIFSLRSLLWLVRYQLRYFATILFLQMSPHKISWPNVDCDASVAGLLLQPFCEMRRPAEIRGIGCGAGGPGRSTVFGATIESWNRNWEDIFELEKHWNGSEWGENIIFALYLCTLGEQNLGRFIHALSAQIP